MKGYIWVARNSIMGNIVYRSHFFFTFIGNVLVITLTFFLWKTIYGDASDFRGLSFNNAFISMAFSRTIFIMFMTYTDWDMSFSIINGTITQVLIKPVDYQLYQLAGKMGELLLNFIIIAIPSILMLIFVFRVSIPFGVNLLFFSIAIILSFIISFAMEFIVGLISFYTQSIWGISTMKNLIIMVFSGILVPLAFFPAALRTIVEYLPFRAMYDIPMRMLLAHNESVLFYLGGYGVQIFWILAISLASRIFYRQAIRVVTISGG